ncbi:hypothetical protein M3J54_25315, partial [Enterobacter hormaechei]
MSVIFTPRARSSRWKALWPLALLLAVAQGALGHMAHRAIDRPRTELLGQRLQQRPFAEGEAEPRTGQA